MSAEPPKTQEKQKKTNVCANLGIELGVFKLLFAIWINSWSFVAFRYERSIFSLQENFFLSLPLRESNNNNERISRFVC